MKIRASIVGATGYTGVMLTQLLAAHPQVDIAYLASSSAAGKYVHQIYPHLKGAIEGKRYQEMNLDKIAKYSDLVFVALPTDKAIEFIQALSSKTVNNYHRIIDMSGGHRTDDREGFSKYYALKPPPSSALANAVYGLPELYKAQIAKSNFIANPGCMATCAIIPLLPLLKAKLIEFPLYINAFTGSSGSGRKASLASSCSEQSNGMRPYKIHRHRHRLEVESVIKYFMGKKADVSFNAVSTDMVRGIQCIINAKLKQSSSKKELVALYRDYFSDDSFVRLMFNNRTSHHMYPNPKLVIGSNYCDIGFEIDDLNNTITLISCIDNLMKGAAGQAIQNMNIAYGLHERCGLEYSPLYPA